MHILHRWTRWKQYKKEFTDHRLRDGQEPFAARSTMLRQQRVCLVCNKMQDKRITTIADIQAFEEERTV